MKHAALQLLLVGYLHEDWTLDYPDFWHAVDDFIDGEPYAASRFRAEAEELVAECPGEPELQQALRELGSTYYPPGAGWESYRAWLLAVADYVEKNLHKSPAA
ncbi:MAG: hypothetical protein JO144_16355 [Actinobacteria bacterium]|nr:hypothetical protein [Actinomycetota bacterium]